MIGDGNDVQENAKVSSCPTMSVENENETTGKLLRKTGF